MRAGPFANGLVTAPASVVVLDYAAPNNVYPDIESVSISRELPSNLPASVVGGTGITAATGDVTWAQPEAVRDTDVSPWRHGEMVPQPGRPVLVSMTGDANLSGGYQTVFTGEVDNTDGATGQSVSSSLVDLVTARFSRLVSVSPKARWMYPPREADPYRLVGLTYAYVVDAILRDCGYFTTPPWEYDPSLTLPLQGTVWAEHGLCETAGTPSGSTNSHASFVQADGRLYATEFVATYRPRLGRPGGNARLNEGVQISVTLGADHGGLTDITVPYGSDYIRLRINATGNIIAYWTGFTEICRINSSPGRRVSLLVTPEGNWQIRTSLGQVAGGVQAVTGTATMGNITVDAAAGARIAGVIVSHPNTPGRQHASLSFTQTAFLRPGTITHQHLEAHRAIAGEKALDVLQEIAAATCSSFRLDEDGHFRWEGPGVLQQQSPVTTVQARTSLLSLAWRVSLDHVRATTTVEWEQALISRSRWPKTTLWEGSSESLAVDESLHESITPPADEDWLGVHLPAVYAGADTGGDERINRGIGSVVGGAAINTSGDPSGVWFSPTYGSASINTMGDNTWAYLMEVTSLPGGGDHFATQMSPGGGGLWPKWDGYALPILRGYIKATWAEQSVTAQGIYAGDPDRPWLVHNAGKWISRFPGSGNRTDGDVPGRLADWIQQQVQTPQVEVTGCEIMPDPRIQLGDVINIADPDNLAVQIRGLVTGIDLSQSGPDMSMSLSLQVIAATPTAVTYAEFEDAWAGADYAALEAAWTGSTYADFEADPLEGAP